MLAIIQIPRRRDGKPYACATLDQIYHAFMVGGDLEYRSKKYSMGFSGPSFYGADSRLWATRYDEDKALLVLKQMWWEGGRRVYHLSQVARRYGYEVFKGPTKEVFQRESLEDVFRSLRWVVRAANRGRVSSELWRFSDIVKRMVPRMQEDFAKLNLPPPPPVEELFSSPLVRTHVKISLNEVSEKDWAAGVEQAKAALVCHHFTNRGIL